MQTKVILVKPGDQLMNSNLGTVNQAKCLMSTEETKFTTSPADIAEAFNNHFTNIDQSLAQEFPSS